MTAANGTEKDLTAEDLILGRPVPTPDSRVAVITGASSGIGLAAAVEFARRGWTVALVGRDQARLAEAAALVRRAGPARPEAFRCDFAALTDVRELAARLRAAYPRIDVLANNAGAVFSSRSDTIDGFEATIQVNHLAPFLLSHELLPVLRGGRMINTSSGAHSIGRLDPDDLSGRGRRYVDLARYGSAKQANILFAAEAARRWPEIVCASYHPGVVRTRFGADKPLYALYYRYAPWLRTPERGARTLVWLATVDASALRSGGYYIDERERRAAARATDPGLAARLWEASLDAITPLRRS